jgi:hypothetical protein
MPVEEANDDEEEDSGPFLRIESVVSLNPDAMKTEDVSCFSYSSGLYFELYKSLVLPGSKEIVFIKVYNIGVMRKHTIHYGFYLLVLDIVHIYMFWELTLKIIHSSLKLNGYEKLSP